MTAGLPAQIGPCQFGIARELDHRALPSRLRSGYAPGGWAVGAGHPSMVAMSHCDGN